MRLEVHLEKWFGVTEQPKKTRYRYRALLLIGQLPTLPHSRPCSTIGAEGLNFRVRDGNGCDPLAMVTQKLSLLEQG